MAGMCAKPSEICTKVAQFVANNSLFMHTQYDESGGTDPYWYHVNLFTAQLSGLLEGYSLLGLESLSYDDLLYESMHVQCTHATYLYMYAMQCLWVCCAYTYM